MKSAYITPSIKIKSFSSNIETDTSAVQQAKQALDAYSDSKGTLKDILILR